MWEVVVTELSANPLNEESARVERYRQTVDALRLADLIRVINTPPRKARTVKVEK